MSVTIVHLYTMLVVAKFKFEAPMNHALISPDGRYIVAVGDGAFAYFYKRIERQSKSYDSDGIFKIAPYDWQPCPRIQLEGENEQDYERKRDCGSFSTAFSASSKYCAVGTQRGIISIYDMCYVADPSIDPLLKIIKSSSPCEKLGAVRTMKFSPSP